MAATRRARSEDALSEIVGFVLVLAMIVVASTLYLMYVVPAEGREDEITQMNQVQDRFISYKTSVDGLWMRSLADLSVPGTRGVSLSTSFDLGTGGGNTQSSGLFLSFMKPIGTAAKMKTQLGSDPNAPTTERMDLRVNGVTQFTYPNEDDPDNPWTDVPVGSLGYFTDNYYWIQQNYYYKLGGIFLEQPGEGVSVKVAPPIAIYQVTNQTSGLPAVKVSLSLVNITSEDSTVGGTGPLRVETRLRESMTTPYRNEPVNSVYLRIYKQKPNGDADIEWLDAWVQAFRDAAQKSGISGTEVDDWVDIRISGHYADLMVTDPTSSNNVFLDLAETTLQVTFEYDE